MSKPTVPLLEATLAKVRFHARVHGLTAAARTAGISRPTLLKALRGEPVARHVAARLGALVIQ